MDLPLMNTAMKPNSYILLPLNGQCLINLFNEVGSLLGDFYLLRELTGMGKWAETSINTRLLINRQGQFYVTIRAILVALWVNPGNYRNQSMDIPTMGVKVCNCQTPDIRGKSM